MDIGMKRPCAFAGCTSFGEEILYPPSYNILTNYCPGEGKQIACVRVVLCDKHKKEFEKMVKDKMDEVQRSYG
jgi:hypothetical protein